jgi:diguanylate cyclase (GGDEF)-like protein
MKLGTSLLRSKVSRRLFVLFILSGLFPIALFALLSFGYVNQQLVSYAKREIQRDSKSVGMEIIGRLSMADAELKLVASRLDVNRDTSPPGNLAGDSERLEMAMLVDESALPSTLGIQPLTDVERLRLESGQTLLKVIAHGDERTQVLLAHKSSSEDTGPLVVGLVDKRFLFDDLALDDAELCVTNDMGKVLACSTAIPRDVTDRLGTLTPSPTELRWDRDGETFFAGYWSVFLEGSFGAKPWTIVVGQADSSVFVALRRFQAMFPLVIVISSVVILLLSVTQIRRQLVPLEKLNEGTERLRNGDFETAVDIDSGDEFEELATSFNGMASHIRKQFGRLGTMAEIDRAILSTSDADYIVETLLRRIRELVACDVTWIVLMDKADPCKAQLRLQGASETTAPRVITLREEERSELLEATDTLEFDDSRPLPSYVSPVTHHGMTHFLVLPVLIKETLAGVIGLGYRCAPELERDDIQTAQELANRAAVALSNAAWEEKLYHQAHYDTLTNLPNRVLFKDRLEQAMGRADRNRALVALFFVDLDGFKTINDSLGHATGDLFLVEISRRLQAKVRAADTLVRFGGDEFTLVVPDLVDDDRVGSVLSKIAKQLLKTLEQHVNLGGHDIQLSGSIGIAVYPRDAESFEGLVSKADLAMYHAKTEGRNNFQFYSDDLNAAALERMKISASLRRALERGELELVYQPQVNMQSREIVGAECLMRWRSPGGNIPPTKFIPVAEETGLIIPIGTWAIEAACAQNKRWQDQGLPPIRLAVNVSARQFRAGDLVSVVQSALDTHSLDPRCLELEVTEGTLAEDVEHTAETLRTLRDMGVQIAVDDFGTGYSSLNYLAQFPIDMLKIDQSFVQELQIRTEVDTIVSAIIGLAHSLDLRVIAEGVETPGQLEFLRTHSCEVLQGNLFSAAVSPDALSSLRREWGAALAHDPDVTISQARLGHTRRT